MTSLQEEPAIEELPAVSSMIKAASSREAMLAIGTGHVLRRYAFLPPPAPVNLGLEIQAAIELSWESEINRTYVIETSVDQKNWTPALPGALPGTGGRMHWSGVRTSIERFFRVVAR